MALAQGISGTISGAIAATGVTFNGDIDNWVLENTVVIDDTSSFGGAGWSKYTTGKKAPRGAATGWLKTDADPGLESAGATAASLILTYATGKTYTGDAIIFNVRVGPVSYKRGGVPLSFQFVINGALTAA